MHFSLLMLPQATAHCCMESAEKSLREATFFRLPLWLLLFAVSYCLTFTR